MKIPGFLSLRRMAAPEILLNGMAIYWFMMLPAVFGRGNAAASATRFLLLPAMILMFWVTAKKLNEVVRAAAVLRQLRAPDALWRQMIFDAMRYTGLVWLFAATGCTLQMSLPASGVLPLAGAALMSLVALLAAGRSLSAAPRVHDIALAVIGLPLLLAAPGELFDWFGNLPGALLAIMALSFPALLLLLERRWRNAPPLFRWAAGERANSWLDLVRAQLSRYSVLTWQSSFSNVDQGPTSNLGRLFLTAMPLVMMSSSAPVFADGQFNIIRFATLMIMSLLLMSGLVVRDFHWRSMLLPGGMRHGRLGFEIWFWTMAAQFLFLGMLLTAAIATLQFGPHPSWPILAGMLAKRATLPLEIAFIVGVAVALRALPHSGFWAVSMALATFIVVIVAWGGTAANHGKIAVALPLYLGLMSGATMLLVFAANRMWSLKKLTDAAMLAKRPQ